MSATSNDSSSMLKRFNRKQDFSNEELAYREEVPTSTSSVPLLSSSRMSRHFSFLRTPEFRERALAYSLGLLARLLVLVAIIGVMAGLGIGLLYTEGLPEDADYSDLQFNWTVNPSSYLKPYNSSFTYNILLDGHSHSTYSDGKMTVRQLLDWHIANGYNAVIVSDHNTIEGGLAAEKLALAEYNNTITVIPAIEYSCCRLHMNLIGINGTVKIGPPVPTDQDLQAVINQTHAMGGIVIVNHIPWSNTTEDGYQVPRLPNHPSIEDLKAWGVDGFEIINQDTFDYPTMQFCQENNLIQMTGSDVHYPNVPANAWTLLQTTNNTKAAILNEIRARRTSFLFDPTGTNQRAYPNDNSNFWKLAPVTGLGDYFGGFYSDSKGMYSFQGTFCQPEELQVHSSMIGWFIFWLLLSVLVFELVRAAVLSLYSYFLRRKSPSL
ncbi:hypothetical protein INT43_004865 [Umbelopsis isabellina]|uniref:Polymerase/histidinol phosphatase N-terminal domain-containing protein n=1 Tax=Mortierella isabellina TaxID=91625 RepID=A0A8H7PEA3_MORIS|nr:hypothetical protein INT43_004865 [Umbelopsis isabellina]